MIKQLRISNFKVFGQRQTLDMAPITLIYGPNSGGKSTLIQSLLLMKQSIETNAGSVSQRVLHPNGRWVDLGQSKSMHHMHRMEDGLSFGITFDIPKRLQNPLFSRDDQLSIDTVFLDAGSNYGRTLPEMIRASYSVRSSFGRELEASVFRSTSSDSRTYARENTRHEDEFRENRFRFESNLDIDSLIEFCERRTPEKSQKRSLLNEAKSSMFDDLRISFRSPFSLSSNFLPSYVRPPGRESPGSLTVGPYTEVNRLLSSLAAYYERTFRSISYLGPLRSRPRRVHEFSKHFTDTVGSSGEFSIDALAQLGRDSSDGIPVIERLNQWFHTFEIPYYLELSSVGDEVLGDIAKLTLVDTRTGIHVAATDVGFGIGQILPVLVEGIIASDGRRRLGRAPVICVEQPELHLHPRLQAAVGDFLIETSQKGGCQWIVETHSEALMLRLQKRIRQQTLSHRDISVLFVNPIGQNGSEVLRLELDEDGNFIDEWPGGFFEEGFREIFF
jgi:hypothetical protein